MTTRCWSGCGAAEHGLVARGCAYGVPVYSYTVCVAEESTQFVPFVRPQTDRDARGSSKLIPGALAQGRGAGGPEINIAHPQAGPAHALPGGATLSAMARTTRCQPRAPCGSTRGERQGGAARGRQPAADSQWPPPGRPWPDRSTEFRYSLSLLSIPGRTLGSALGVLLFTVKRPSPL